MQARHLIATIFLVVAFLIPIDSKAADIEYHASFGVDYYLFDTDNDGLTDHEERAVFQTDWNNPDTDGDGYDDYSEVVGGYSPKHADLKMINVDTDNDGLNDAWEVKLGTNLMIPDTDGDGYLDGKEMFEGYSPTSVSDRIVDKHIIVSVEDFSMSYYFDRIALQKTVPVSTGKSYTPTPEGEFTVLARQPNKHYYGEGYSYPNTKYNLHFTTNYYRYWIHTAYWHDNFGKAGVSGGCVNVREEDMKLLYDFANIGTKVYID